MNIIIIGCGKVGQTLAEQLSEEGNNVTVIDSDAERVKAVANKIDILGVIGNGASHLTQTEAGIENADLLIAVTGADELNLLACIVAKKAVGCQTIARVRDHVYDLEAPFLKQELGLAMVLNPEEEAAEEIARVLRFPSAISIETFAKGRVELLKFRLPEGSSIVGMSVREVAAKYKCDVLFCTAERGEEAHIVKGDFVFCAKDVISIIASPKNAHDFFVKIGYKTGSVKDAIIVGGGEITHYLCKHLERAGIKLRVIEKDRQLCEQLCEAFPSVTVINADTADQEILAEEGVERIGAFLALCNYDEENIILSLFARSKACGKVVTKINRIDYDDVITRLDLDTVIYPKNVTANKIIRYARAMQNTRSSNMETLYTVIKGKVEAAEFAVRSDCPLVGTPLAQLKINKNVLIGAILRGADVIIPRGNDTIEVGDSVVLVSGGTDLYDVSDILEE